VESPSQMAPSGLTAPIAVGGGLPYHRPTVKPPVLILRAAGVNCDVETAHAFALAGGECESIHVNRLLERPAELDRFSILAFPGGFSFGDDIAAGRILANLIRHHLSDALRRFIAAGKPVIGICNGFQVLIKTGLLPGGTDGGPRQTCTLAHNSHGRFIDRWVHLRAEAGPCVWTRGIDRLELPIAHGEGRFVAADESAIEALKARGQVALRYSTPDGAPAAGRFPDNPNGSTDDIAGVCDPSGLVFGLMPHPERHVDPTQHPAWTARAGLPAEGDGLAVFRNAVEHVRSSGV